MFVGSVAEQLFIKFKSLEWRFAANKRNIDYKDLEVAWYLVICTKRPSHLTLNL